MGNSELLFEFIVFLDGCWGRREVALWVVGESLGCIGLVSEWFM